MNVWGQKYTIRLNMIFEIVTYNDGIQSLTEKSVNTSEKNL